MRSHDRMVANARLRAGRPPGAYSVINTSAPEALEGTGIELGPVIVEKRFNSVHAGQAVSQHAMTGRSHRKSIRKPDTRRLVR
ncbi:hypothetical protein [Thermomonas sp.]